MAEKTTSQTTMGQAPRVPAQFFELGKSGTDALVNMQKELLDSYQEAGQVWLKRVKSEVQLWSELAQQLSGSQSISESLKAYQDCASHRMQMVAEDGQLLLEEGQKLVGAIGKSLTDVWPTKMST